MFVQTKVCTLLLCAKIREWGAENFGEGLGIDAKWTTRLLQPQVALAEHHVGSRWEPLQSLSAGKRQLRVQATTFKWWALDATVGQNRDCVFGCSIETGEAEDTR